MLHALAHPLPFVLLLAALWGALWAAALQWTRFGRWLAARATWVAVVVGVGVDVLILAAVLSPAAWAAVIGVFAASSVPIVARSLVNDMQRDAAKIADLTKEPAREPRHALALQPAHRGEHPAEDET